MFKIKDGFQIDNVEVSGIFTDPRDGHEYPFAEIGTQTWMLTNIDYGTRVDVPSNQTGAQWTQAEGTCYKYKNVDNYGNWTDGSRGGFYLFESLSWVAPPGWHVPSKAELDTLVAYVAETYGSSSASGYPMAALMSATHWYNPTSPKTDDYGFKLLPTGQCYKRRTATQTNWDKSETNDTTARIWVSDSIGSTTERKFVEVGSNSWQGFTLYNWSATGEFVIALPVRLIKDAVRSAEPEEPIITSITTTISNEPSDNKVPTEKAVADAISGASDGIPKSILTAGGDIIIASAANTPTRLAIGSNGQVITAVNGFPAWQTIPGLYLGAFASSNRPQNATTGQTMLDTDLGCPLYRIGSAWVNATGAIIEGNYTPTGTPVRWMVNPMTAAGDLIVGGTDGDPTRLALGSVGNILKIGSNGMAWTADGWDDYPLTAKGDILIGGTDGAPSRLALGTEGQQLFVGSSGLPVWQDVPKTGVQTYPIALSMAAYPAQDYTDRLFVAKVVASHDGKYTALGFGLKSGSTGKVGLAVYDLSHNLVARTELFSASTPPSGHVYWHDTESAFNLVAGNEYFFAIWFGNDPYSNLLQVLGYKNENTFDSSLVGLVLGQQGITEMPSTFSTLNYEQVMFHICAK